MAQSNAAPPQDNPEAVPTSAAADAAPSASLSASLSASTSAPLLVLAPGQAYPLLTQILVSQDSNEDENDMSLTPTFHRGTVTTYEYDADGDPHPHPHPYTVIVHSSQDNEFELKDVEELYTPAQVKWGMMLHKTIGKKVAKNFFRQGVFYGVVVNAVQVEVNGNGESLFDGDGDDDSDSDSGENGDGDGDGDSQEQKLGEWFRVRFDDGDVEDYTLEELTKWMTKYEEEEQKKKIEVGNGIGNGNGNGKLDGKAKKKRAVKAEESTTKKKRVKTKNEEDNVIHVDDDESQDDDDDDDVVMKEETTSVAAATTASGRGSRRTSRSGRTTKITSYFETYPSTDEEEEFQAKPSKRKSTAKANSKANTKSKSNSKTNSNSNSKSKSKKKSGDDSESDFEGNEEESDEDLDSDSDIVMEEDDSEGDVFDFSEDEKPQPKRRAKKGASTSTSSSAKKIATTSTGRKKKDAFATLSEELIYRRDNSGYKPHNNPQTMPDEPYVDPVGVDPTHGIVEGIIAAQVAKVGGLLQAVANRAAKDKELGELTFPLSLQTACSGTDAPSIALGLVKESLDKIHSANEKVKDSDGNGKGNGKTKTKENGQGQGHGFDYTHEMSCEIEPFKQAYIGRNFPGVPLFPDITKLTAGDTCVDVYGRRQEIPDGNLFVAGTSCKDFSMLKTRDRMDIEDKGQSGETFLAAVEFLEVKQPAVAMFENVNGAPWAKMQEYITGRLDLSERNNTKAIKSSKDKADADNDLKFSIDDEGRYVAEEIPRQVGIRAGSIVEGFVKEGQSARNVVTIKSKSKKSGNKFVTLGQMAKEHKINLNTDTLVMRKKARYCTHLCRVDTKNFGLPQTRNRKYLFIWRSDDPEDDLGEYYEKILDHLKTPLLFSMDAFLLPPTHDRIRCFREALRSGPGLMVARERAKEIDFWDWEASHVRDMPLHLSFREKNGIEENMRWLTGWGTRGRKEVAPGVWPELVDMWNMRRCDMIDCFAGAAIRDAVSRDPLHHSFTWDLSQNVTRAPFRSATVGVSGCVTPGGELLLPHKGRTVMGYEKLLLQGIPFSRLLLGPETEVQLSDLAGNAMSVPVICATLLAAICAPELRREQMKDRKAPLERFSLGQKYDSANGAVLAERGDLHKVGRDDDTATFSEVFNGVAKDLAEDAYFSSVLCTCESSGRTTNNPTIFECIDCGMSICHECSDRHQTSTHNLKDINSTCTYIRPDPHVFERKLRCAVPSILRLGEGWEAVLDECEGLESYSFQLQQVDRKKGRWMLTYGAWEDHGSARQVAEVRVIIGRIGTLDSDAGLAAYLKCFAPAIRQKNPLRGRLLESARIFMSAKSDNATTKPICKWKIRASEEIYSLQIKGSQPTPSQRVQAGLGDESFKVIKAHKPMKKFLPKIESRNDLTKYHPKWKSWPGTINISGDDSNRINGTYQRLRCQQTIVLSALWRRNAKGGAPAMYIYLRPDVIRSGLDVAVVSPTPSYHDNLEICELKDWIPENALSESTHSTEVNYLNWKDAPEHLTLEVPQPTMVINDSGPFHASVGTSSSDSSGRNLCEMNGLSRDIIASLLQHTERNSEDGIAEMDLVGRSGTKNAKRLSILAAPSLLKYAAEGKLPLELSKWYTLSSSLGFGNCEKNVPPRPVAEWKAAPGKKTETRVRVYDAEKSNEYYHKLLARPNAFTININKSNGKLAVCMNPAVAAHHAAANLVRGRALGDVYAKSLNVEYCLSELTSMGEPDTKEFHVPNSDAYKESSVDGLELPLYKRQAKALTRMQAIERGDVHFSEEERSEHLLHGIGWCLIARAAKKSPLRGGVLGDAIGSGKTVVTIALILGGIEKARENRSVKDRRSSATLIVVPPGLVKQWDDERKKFTKNKLKCITIDCTNTLKRFSVDEMCNADIVIVPAGIIEERAKTAKSRPYTEHLTKKAKANMIPPAPSGYSQREAPSIEGTWVRNMASGPEIYVGNNGKQRTRDEQGYYGFCYSEAIGKLREKTYAGSERGVPLEYFTWERIVIDECHETLVTGRQHETDAADFKAQARRGAREFLGVAQTIPASRPLVAGAGVWGLTGTPLLETEARVTELANLMGGTYLTGSAHHWRKEERESGRDLFLNQQAGTRSREYRCAIQAACHSYVKEACQRNRGAKLEVKLDRRQHSVNMSSSDGETFLKSISTSEKESSYSVSPDQLGEKASNALAVTTSSTARHHALHNIIDSIQDTEPDTKIIVFSNTFFGGYKSALAALAKSKKEFCHISESNSVIEQNEIISWFRHIDVTDEEKLRPRILLLSFEQAAGHNLQEACHHVIMFDPMYSGADAVADASVEEQAVGRVMRQGQKNDVTVTRIILKGPKGERCFDDWIVERNLDDDVLRAATSNFD
mmetsp:Transcript_18227/g.26821  ORF Transcript_18227/g.26821 Transcript_18227/m.26821 type:complete len:2370 (-) Transcript_18227:73-7182(-)|eukprot:CAMPEP_0194087572 /NCGR_PEP_ID=MMETSP0149-20130528/25622_1 /TAXON_ID=122233 /ORGANISM="Chaetoceros debilis, Strain MM31A-1" /LENGTH=2369 /DNA_ID=CAMNT_0038770961 /DNA_START=119 /DNA_END=7228 /DNA_ORIENTATION=-